MSHRFEDIWQNTATDGASAPVGDSRPKESMDYEGVLDAWFQERQQSIELRLYLEHARSLLSEIVREGEVSPENLRRIRLLILAIKAARRANRRQGQ